MASTEVNKLKLKKNNDPRMPVTISHIKETNPTHNLHRQVNSEFFSSINNIESNIMRLKKEIIPNCYFYGHLSQKPLYQIEHDEKIRLAKNELAINQARLGVIKNHKLMFSILIRSTGKKEYNPLRNFIENIYFDPNIMPKIFEFMRIN